jgi:hypothetical protein
MSSRNHTAVSDSSSLEKENGTALNGNGQNNAHLENIRTVSRVPGNPSYYERDGLRTYGDNEDHDHEPTVKLPGSVNILVY